MFLDQYFHKPLLFALKLFLFGVVPCCCLEVLVFRSATATRCLLFVSCCAVVGFQHQGMTRCLCPLPFWPGNHTESCFLTCLSSVAMFVCRTQIHASLACGFYYTTNAPLWRKPWKKKHYIMYWHKIYWSEETDLESLDHGLFTNTLLH